MNEPSRRQCPGSGSTLHALVALPLLAWAAPAAAQPSSEPVGAQPAAPQVDALVEAQPAPARVTPRIGAMMDVGAPDGASISIVYRPVRALRAFAGLSHNMISLGQRVGVTLTPGWFVSPTLTLEYGRYAEGNANPLIRLATGDDTFSSAVAERIGYQYGNARLGLEVGRKWFTFYLHAGMSRISGRVHNLSSETMSEQAGTTTVSFPSDPDVRLWTASASLGFVVYLAK